jgi:hypothetical protein
MRIRDILDYIENHYDEFPNFDGRTPQEILELLPDQDPRYENEEGLIDLLNEVNYRDEPRPRGAEGEQDGTAIYP